MQKINKDNDGVTLIALVVTLIILSIILGISINYGITGTKSVKNKKMEAELSIVQEAVMQRYALVKSQNKLGIYATIIRDNIAPEDDTERPTGFVGTRLASCYTIFDYGFNDVYPMIEYAEGAVDKTYEEYYYWLNEYDLEAIGIKEGRDSTKERIYIVNYFTGEIFDVANQRYYVTRTQNDDSIYMQPGIIRDDGKQYEFNDD